VVEAVDAPNRKPKTGEYIYHVLRVKPDGIETVDMMDMPGSSNASVDITASSTSSTFEQEQLFLKPGHMIRLDASLAVRSSCGKLFGM